MKRILLTLAFLAFPFAAAQEMPWIQLFTMVAANEMDTVMVECPESGIEEPHACFMHELGVDWARMDWESFVRTFYDMEWAIPWQQNANNASVGRMLRVNDAGREHIVGVLLMPWGDRGREALVVVVESQR